MSAPAFEDYGSMVFHGERGVLGLRFSVAGDPAPQGSKKHVGKGVMIEASKASRPWRAEIVAAANELPLDAMILGPVRVELRFYFHRPTSHWGTGRNEGVLKESAPDYKQTNPDVDKLARTVLDALVLAGVLRDDGQVAVLLAEKRYALKPGLTVEIRPLS